MEVFNAQSRSGVSKVNASCLFMRERSSITARESYRTANGSERVKGAPDREFRESLSRSLPLAVL